MSKTVLPLLVGQKVSAFCEIPQRGKPKKGNREQRLVGFALAATRV